MGNFVVIDTETTWTDTVMSIGLVIADEACQVLDSRYYLIDPAYRQDAMYSGALFLDGQPKPLVGSRRACMQDILKWLHEYDVCAIFAYNARFDCKHLPELSCCSWYDIMRLAAYRQYNESIRHLECCKTGRLKHSYGVVSILRLLSGNRAYCEKHNGWFDAMDELKIMQLLGQPLSAYEIAKIQ